MLTRVLIPIAILLVGYGAWHWLSKPVPEPKPEHHPPQKLKTEKLELARQDFTVTIESQGIVRAHHTTTITPLVAGTVQTIHPGFEDGAFFKKDDILAELDPADLQAAQTAAEAAFARAEAALAQEQARAKQAKLNWQDLGYDEQPSPLVLRIPQLKEANAAVTAARANLDQASRNLERTKIRAPFDGRVKQRMIGLGQAVSASTPLGEIFATDFAEVRLPLTPDQLAFLKLPTHDGDPPLPVTLHDAFGKVALDEAATWQATIIRTEGTLDETSRELFAIARIDDPYGLVSRKPELRIGQPVRADIQGITLHEVFVIPRAALRGINRVYLIDRDELKIQKTPITPIWSTTDTLVVRDGLDQGAWLATSRLPYAPDGAPVELLEAQ